MDHRNTGHRSSHKSKKVFKGGKKKLSAKIAKVRREDPSLTARQATGKAAGILAQRAKKKRMRA